MKLSSGKLLELINKHDLSRVIQAMIQFGTPADRDKIIAELNGSFVKISKGIYTKHIVLKLLKYGNQAQKDKVLSEFYGKVAKLIAHKDASVVVEYAYTNFSNSIKQALIKEFYGPQFAINPEMKQLSDLLIAQPFQKDIILKHLGIIVNKLIAKQLFDNTISHKVIYDFLQHSEPKSIKHLIETLTEFLIQITHTKEGALISIWCVSFATVKERKAILKTFKGNVLKMFSDEYAVWTIIRLFDWVDDTIMTKKMIISEVLALPNDQLVDQIFNHKYARLPFLYLASPQNKSNFPPALKEALQPAMIEGVLTSKKNDEVRRKELLSGVMDRMVEVLSDPELVKKMMVNDYGSAVVQEWVDVLTDDTKEQVYEVIAEVAGDEEDGLLHNFVAKRVIKRLVKKDNLFAKLLLKHLGGRLVFWAKVKGADFVIESLLDWEDLAGQVKQELKKHVKELQQKQKEPGVKALLKKLGVAVDDTKMEA